MPRRTLKDIRRHPSPAELFDSLLNAEGYPYRTGDLDAYRRRDRALVAFLYLTACRIGEALTVKGSQFTEEADRILIRGVPVEKKKKPEWKDCWLPQFGERQPFTDLVMQHHASVKSADRLWPFTRGWARQIVLGQWNHYYRALGERQLYRAWNNDLVAVGSYLHVSPVHVIPYIGAVHEDLPAV